MDAITKESPEWLAALTLVPEWTPNQKCPGKLNAIDAPEGHQWIPCRHRRIGTHVIETPDITSDLLYAILEAGMRKDARLFSEMVLSRYQGNLADAIILTASLQ